jgi:hypothetical protein
MQNSVGIGEHVLLVNAEMLHDYINRVDPDGEGTQNLSQDRMKTWLRRKSSFRHSWNGSSFCRSRNGSSFCRSQNGSSFRRNWNGSSFCRSRNGVILSPQPELFILLPQLDGPSNREKAESEKNEKNRLSMTPASVASNTENATR